MKKFKFILITVVTAFIFLSCEGIGPDSESDPVDPILSNEKEITAFSFTIPSAMGVITGTNITITVPYGSDITALMATITTTGRSLTVGGITQINGITANDFTNAVIFTVMAEDSTTLNYIVTVIVAAAVVESSGFSSASNPGDSYILTLVESSETLIMIYANNSVSITFPTGIDDSGTATLINKFFMGETEVTNAVMAAVLQWAFDNNQFSSIVGDHNGLDTITVKHGGQELLDLDDINCRIDYDGSSTFSVESGYENSPVTNITWYGSIMFCAYSGEKGHPFRF